MKKFEYIYNDIKTKILDGVYKMGEFLPKEQDLASEYQVSRETLRKAQRLLQDEGIIQKIHGRGTKVLDPQKIEINTRGITNFAQLSHRYGRKLKTKILTNKLTYLSENEFGYRETLSRPGISIERIRYLNKEPIILDQDFFLIDKVGRELPDEILLASIYDYLEIECGLKIGYAQKDITIEPPSDEVRLALDITEDTHVVVTRSLVYLENTDLFQVHVAYQRVDTFQLSDIARRKINR
ncbi:UTRA domain-containing protein [Vagococcus elongatus]|uniref:HTH gntR-type domain-containing protein n=1 Tax=Vagococcus elongatus TaxID=180344 RepID=A0A430B493_9ENTE|nr:UTRA domain-containing protein [Vagococcus elongatus]RSU15145.1 hypothetical protein CBF29_02090 [Vagococcus elongatus]